MRMCYDDDESNLFGVGWIAEFLFSLFILIFEFACLSCITKLVLHAAILQRNIFSFIFFFRLNITIFSLIVVRLMYLR